MKRTFVVCLVLAFLITIVAAFALFAGDAPDTFKFDSKKGAVTLSHKVHAEEYKIECTTCHHTYKEGDTVKKCKDCHGVDEAACKPMKAFHDNCKGCHKTVNEEGKSAPTVCKECHIK